MTKISSNHAIFNRVFFNFSFKLIGKKISVYIAIFIYLLIIAAYTIIVPLIANRAPIELFTVSTSSMFLMFAMSIVSCYIAIEIFRTGIDDGTELLTVSKPISRKEIITVKLIIFLIYTIIVALISLIIAAFTFLEPLSASSDSSNIMLGIFVGTIVSGIIFGSIATILSIYVKKISAMLITVAISFILMLISMLMSFIVTTPVQYISDSGKSIASINAVNYSDKNKKVSFNQGITAYDSSSGEFSDPQQVWNDAVKHSGYNYDVQFDFGYQISSIFTLGSVNTDFQKVLRTLSALNQPVNLTFKNYDLNNFSGINVYYSDANINGPLPLFNLYLNSLGSSSLANATNNQNSYNAKMSYTDGDISNMNTNVVNAGIDTSSSTTVVNYWNDAWTKYQPQSSTTSGSTGSSSTTPGNSSSQQTPIIASQFATNFFTQNKLSPTNPSQIKTLIKQFNEIQYSAFVSLVYNGVKISMDTSNTGAIQQGNIPYQISDENKVQLGLLGVVVPSTDILVPATDADNALRDAMSQIKFQNSITFSINTSSSNTSTTLVLSNPFSLLTNGEMSSAKTVDVQPVLRNEVIIPVWVAVAIIIFIIAIALYFRRDFA